MRRVHIGSTSNTTHAVENTGTSGPSLRGAIQTSVNGGNITSTALSGSGVKAQNFGPVATGASTGNFTVTHVPTAAGPLSGQAVHIANNFGNVAEQTLNITGAAYALASPTVTSSLSSPFNFGVVQAGQTYTGPLTITNTVVASSGIYQEGLNASFGTPTNTQLMTNGGSITNLTADSSNSSAMSVVNADPRRNDRRCSAGQLRFERGNDKRTGDYDTADAGFELHLELFGNRGPTRPIRASPRPRSISAMHPSTAPSSKALTVTNVSCCPPAHRGPLEPLIGGAW